MRRFCSLWQAAGGTFRGVGPRLHVPAALLLLSLAVAAPAAAIDVTNTNDAGPGSLRAAIIAANATPGSTIAFRIPALPPGEDVVTIQPLSPLPTITADGTLVDGTAQTALTGNTNPSGPEVVLNGANAGAAANGLFITAANCRVRSLCINRFQQNGIRISNTTATGNRVTGCYIGTDPYGTSQEVNFGRGVQISGGATANFVGGTTAADANVISGNDIAGVGIFGPGTDGNSVLGNRIGTDRTGSYRIGNIIGVAIHSSAKNNIVGGPGLGQNLISGNWNAGVSIFNSGTEGNQVLNNRIGTNAAGTDRVENFIGVLLSVGAKNNVIGGTLAQRNLISGNSSVGVQIVDAGTNLNTVSGNYIGVNVNGNLPLRNDFAGVYLGNRASSNLIGGTSTSVRNIISCNRQVNVFITDAATTGNLIRANYIGTDLSGTVAMPLNRSGVEIVNGARANIVGGDVAGARNLINGHSFAGVFLSDTNTTDNRIQGNHIGVNGAGTLARPNGVGIWVSLGAHGTLIGGPTAVTRNVISGNQGTGVRLEANNCLVAGNYIGTNASGNAAIGNEGDGVLVLRGTGNVIGGGVSENGNLANVISGNAEHGVQVLADSTRVLGNRIGTNVGGSTAVPNGGHGVRVVAAQCRIGDEGQGNLISGNGIDGVRLETVRAASCLVRANVIGTNAAGTLAIPNVQCGVSILNGANNNTVGGDGAQHRNLISGNNLTGVRIFGVSTNANNVYANYIGVTASGLAALPNMLGVTVLGAGGSSASANRIGATDGRGNLISGNAHHAVVVGAGGLSGNQVVGNTIGTNALGAATLPNGGWGVVVGSTDADAASNSNTLVSRNLISGNGQGGVAVLSNAIGATMQSNTIGADAGGVAALPNQGAGIFIFQAQRSVVGGSLQGQGNLISANLGDGVLVEEVFSLTRIEQNLIGTQVDGATALGNQRNGVRLVDASSVRIGGAGELTGNVISANADCGILVSGPDSFGTLIQRNRIGTNQAGNAALGNGDDGVRVERGGPSTMIGASAALGNVICANAGDGVEFRGPETSGGIVRGNLIGAAAADGLPPLPNQEAGVKVYGGVQGVEIGGAATGQGNFIHNNVQDGILVSGPTTAGVHIRRNSITRNGGLGINLQNSGAPNVVTLNDNGDGDTGANGLQNFPEITSVTVGANTVIQGQLLGFEPNKTFIVELFRDGVDPSGFGEGETYLAFRTVTTDASGFATFSFSIAGPIFSTPFTTTATDTVLSQTSEFSAARFSPPQ